MTLNITAPAVSVMTTHEIYSDSAAYAFGASSLGHVLVAVTRQGICAILLGSDRERLIADLKQNFPVAHPAEDDEVPGDWIGRIVARIETPTIPFDLPLDLRGSDTEVKVWQALRTIPAGKTMSYSDLAELIGMKGTAKDVSEACAANRIAVVIPCHRIVRKDGSISGYRWGVSRKRALLKREGAL